MYITSPALDGLNTIRHAFFTRENGTSEGIYASFNGGPGSSDNPAHIQANRNLMADHLGVPPENFLSLYQIHSSSVLTVKSPWPSNKRPQADGMVTKEPGIALAICTADCGPLLFADSENGVIGAAHAGWKGAAGGIIEATLEEMEALGADRSHITVTLGATITQASYEVGAEFLETFLMQTPLSTQFFKASTKPHHFMFDLPNYILWRLNKAGVERCSFLGYCTYENDNLFYSYRRSVHRNEPDYGRLVSAICLIR